MSRGTVPNELLRERFLASGMTPSEVAIAAGWESRGRPDSSRVAVALGLRPSTGGRGFHRGICKKLEEDTALELGRALGLDPFEIGL
jgi:hypothetical protein